MGKVKRASAAPLASQLAPHYHDLDLILLAFTLPDVDGLSVPPELYGLAPATPMVIWSASASHADVQCALHAGAECR